MPRPRPDPTHRVAVIDPNYASRERMRSLLVRDHRTCVAVSDPGDIAAMSARARRLTWAFLVCDGPIGLAERQIAALRHAVARDLPILVAVPRAQAEAVGTLLAPRDGIVALPCPDLQLAARLVDFARLHQLRPRRSAALRRARVAVSCLATDAHRSGRQ